MIIVTIGEASRRLSNPAAAESWVTLHMRTTTGAAEPPPVHMRVLAPGVALNLSAGVRVGVRGPALSEAEEQVMSLWRQRALDRPAFRSGQVVAFLHQLHDLLPAASGDYHAPLRYIHCRAPVAQVDRAQVS